jgi:hypothetical protein
MKVLVSTMKDHSIAVALVCTACIRVFALAYNLPGALLFSYP